MRCAAKNFQLNIRNFQITDVMKILWFMTNEIECNEFDCWLLNKPVLIDWTKSSSLSLYICQSPSSVSPNIFKISSRLSTGLLDVSSAYRFSLARLLSQPDSFNSSQFGLAFNLMEKSEAVYRFCQHSCVIISTAAKIRKTTEFPQMPHNGPINIIITCSRGTTSNPVVWIPQQRWTSVPFRKGSLRSNRTSDQRRYPAGIQR